jgi:hypothetical protein
LTLTSLASSLSSSISSVRSIHGARTEKSEVSSSTGALSAMPRIPSSTACFAAASVPECQVELPRFRPRLIPERTTSTRSHWLMPSATQSAGVPLTRYASTSSKMCVGRKRTGREAVIACPADDCSTSGATTRTSPNLVALRASAAIPGL